jgi:hypothetical protein
MISEKIRSHWKPVLLVLCVYVLYVALMLRFSDADITEVGIPAAAATAVTVFLYRKVARKLGL